MINTCCLAKFIQYKCGYIYGGCRKLDFILWKCGLNLKLSTVFIFCEIKLNKTWGHLICISKFRKDCINFEMKRLWDIPEFWRELGQLSIWIHFYYKELFELAKLQVFEKRSHYYLYWIHTFFQVVEKISQHTSWEKIDYIST